MPVGEIQQSEFNMVRRSAFAVQPFCCSSSGDSLSLSCRVTSANSFYWDVMRKDFFFLSGTFVTFCRHGKLFVIGTHRSFSVDLCNIQSGLSVKVFDKIRPWKSKARQSFVFRKVDTLPLPGWLGHAATSTILIRREMSLLLEDATAYFWKGFKPPARQRSRRKACRNSCSLDQGRDLFREAKKTHTDMIQTSSDIIDSRDLCVGCQNR